MKSTQAGTGGALGAALGMAGHSLQEEPCRQRCRDKKGHGRWGKQRHLGAAGSRSFQEGQEE